MPPIDHPPGKVEEAYELPRRPLRWVGFWVLLGFVGGLASGVVVARGTFGAKGCACASGGKGGICGLGKHPQPSSQAPTFPKP